MGALTYALNMSAKSESRFHVYVLSQYLLRPTQVDAFGHCVYTLPTAYFVPHKWMHFNRSAYISKAHLLSFLAGPILLGDYVPQTAEAKTHAHARRHPAGPPGK